MACSRRVLDEVLTALPTGLKLKPSQIHKRQQFLSLVTVRHALRELCEEGLVTYEGPDCLRRYSRNV